MMYGHGGGAYGIHVVRDGFRVEVVEESDDGTVEEVGEEEEEGHRTADEVEEEEEAGPNTGRLNTSPGPRDEGEARRPAAA